MTGARDGGTIPVDPRSAVRAPGAHDRVMMSSISVVIPCYNAEPFLAEAIESALAQDRPALEVIVADDASTDASAAIASRYPVTVLRSSHNLGPSAARNRAISEARGDLVAFLDADDHWEAHHLATVAGLLERHPEAVVAYGAVRHFGDREGVWRAKVTPGVPFDALGPLLCQQEQPPQMSSVVRREALARVGGYRLEYRYSQDYALWLDLAKIGRFVCTDLVTASYRWHGTQISTVRRSEQRVEAHRARLAMINRLTDEGAPDASRLSGEAARLLTEDLVACWEARDWVGSAALVQLARAHGVMRGPRWAVWRLAHAVPEIVRVSATTRLRAATGWLRRWLARAGT